MAVPPPQLQVDFAFALEQIRETYLQEALSRTVSRLDITEIDAELAQIVSRDSLTQVQAPLQILDGTRQ